MNQTFTTSKTPSSYRSNSASIKADENADTSGMPIGLVQFLVVDDYPFVRRIVTEGLKACGAKNIYGAQDGREAISFLKLRSPSIRDDVLLSMMDARPDIIGDLAPQNIKFSAAHSTCVITDFSMENGNGLQVLKAIRCGQTNVPRQTPVILLTGYSDDFVIATALDLDVSAFIVKPVSRDTLRDRLQRVLRSAPQPKSIETYMRVEIPDEKGRYLGHQAAAKISKQDWERDEEGEICWLPLMAIQPGAVLAEDLRTERGALLMKAGTALSAFVLQRLRDVADSDGLSGNIPIRRMPEPHAGA